MKKVLCVILSMLLIVLTFASCGGNKETANTPDNADASADGSDTDAAAAASSFPSKLIAQKKAEVYAKSATFTDGGVIYTDEEGLSGFGPFDGRYDTGASFAYVEECGTLFAAIRSPLAGTEPADLNVFNLYNAKGDLLASGYAKYEYMNKFFIKAYTATEKTFSTNEKARLFKKENRVSFSSSSDAEGAYLATFEVLNAETGTVIPNIDFSALNSANAAGRTLGCTDKEGNYAEIFPDGSEAPKTVNAFEDGFFCKEETDGAAAYDPDGNEIFQYNPNDYSLYSKNGDYFVAKKYVNGEVSYFLVDLDGNKVSAEFTNKPSVYGTLLKVDDVLCDFNGNEICSLKDSSVSFDTMTKGCWIIHKDDDYRFIYENGATMLSVTKKDKVDVYTSTFCAVKRNDDGYFNFSVKDNDYTIKGNSLCSFVTSVTDGDGRYDAVDNISGETLFEGYSSLTYSSPQKTDNGTYVLAKRVEGNFDVYLIQNEFDAARSNLSDALVSAEALKLLYAKQQDLFTELEKAFADKGITATIDRVSGEIGIDSNVIFGGDSAELSDAGKEVLKQFISAYVSIVSDAKYAGFIEKTVIEGNTAPVDGVSYEEGLPLSEERANTVLGFFTSDEAGVSVNEGDFEAIGNSNANPVYNLDGTVNMDASRRVSFRFIINEDYQG